MKNSEGTGFTLVEVLISIVILAIFLFGLLYAISTSLVYSTKNVLRNEATKLADELIETGVCVSGNSTTYTTTIDRQIRNSHVIYYVNCTISDVCTNNDVNCKINIGKVKKIDIKITWTYKGKAYTYETSTLQEQP